MVDTGDLGDLPHSNGARWPGSAEFLCGLEEGFHDGIGPAGRFVFGVGDGHRVGFWQWLKSIIPHELDSD